jgi:hypothetical protein
LILPQNFGNFNFNYPLNLSAFPCVSFPTIFESTSSRTIWDWLII